VRRDDLLAFEIRDKRGAVASLRGLALVCGGDLRKMREIGLAQHEADVGVGDQPAFTVDDIGIAGPPHLDRGDDVPDQFEIDLGYGDAGVAPALRHRETDVRFGFLAEIHWAEPEPGSLRFDETRILRPVGVAADDVHRQPRDLELLAAIGIELRDLRDRRDLAKQADIIEPPLLHPSRRPLRMGRPTNLAFDVGDELGDALRRRLRLLLLNPECRQPHFTVGKPHVHQTTHDQDQCDQPDQRQNVLAKQATPPRVDAETAA
jgi:hypothetical protein